MEIQQINVTEVTVLEDRTRKEFDKGKLQRLAESFKRIGQLQPGVCTKLDGRFILAAGERRLRACTLANIPFSFVLKEEADPALLLEIELEENLNRVDLTWQEEVAGRERLHLLRGDQKARLGQTQRTKDTAEELNISVGIAHEDLELAQWAKEFPEVAEAKNKTEAKKIIKRYKAEVIRRKFFEEAVETAEESKARVDDAPEKVTSGEPQEEFIEIGGKKIPTELILEFDKRIIQGDMREELEKFKDESIDLIPFDPPWGVDYDKVRMKGGSTSDFEDDRETYLKELPGYLELLWRKLAPNSHLYMFFGIVHYQYVYEQLCRVGFSVNHMPLIWYKQGAHVTRNPEIWPGRSYEPIAYARKGSKPLVKLGAPDVIITAAPNPTMKQSHPASKHPDIYLELLKRSAAPGDTVVDPMAGSCMSAVACEVLKHTHKLDWWMIEREEEFRDLGFANVTRGYHLIVNKEPLGAQEYIPLFAEKPLTEDFKTLEPGEGDWIRYWKAHPEEQEEMLEWRRNKK